MEAGQNHYKVYVCVEAEFSKEGRVIPKKILWEDGTRFSIQKVTEVRKAAATKAGGVGTRYTCIVDGYVCHLFYGTDRKWFVERKVDNPFA